MFLVVFGRCSKKVVFFLHKVSGVGGVGVKLVTRFKGVFFSLGGCGLVDWRWYE